jgi:thiopurine S-methyltransferase
MTEKWCERWRQGRIGWHETSGNVSLRKYWQASGKRVLVPLCGKSVDMLWLEEQGNYVAGVELSTIAARAFFEENAIPYSIREGNLPAYVADSRRITVYCGDIFDFDERGFDACYDRGALVTMPRDARPAYVEHVEQLLAPDAYKLIITVEYNDEIAMGPPFSISEEEMRGYWPELERVDHYDDISNGPPKFRDAGLSEMFESVWR